MTRPGPLGVPLRALFRGLVCAALLTPLAASADAQTVRVTSGEHAGFSRLVLQARGPIDWSLSPEGRTRQLRVAAETLEVDPAAIFHLIPRTRLADLRRTPGGLALVLDCDCEIRTATPGPGVVVIDIHDAPAASAEGQPAPPPTPLPAPATPRPAPPARPRQRALVLAPPFAGDTARTAGAELARRMRAEALAVAAHAPGDASAPTAPDRRPLMELLVRQVSQAVAQGLLATATADPAQVLPGADPPLDDPDLPNLAISRATDPARRLAEAEAGAEPDGCAGTELLAFPLIEDAPPFRDRHAEIMRSLYGEFDVPARDGHAALVRLYLEHGMGAEARLVIENAPAQVSGRDLLLGLSDVFEDRYSNARLRLAERIDCGGAAALFATLAGAEPAAIRPLGAAIARAYSEIALPLRLALGEPLVRRLLGADARDAARMVADALRRSSDPPPPVMSLVDAQLEAARGEIDRAAARLDHDGRPDGAALVMRLGLALGRGERVASGLLADAETIAASERTTETGIALMALLVRLHNAAGEPEAAFDRLDRLARWLPATPANIVLLAELRDATWATMVARAEDTAFLKTVLDRGDWRGDALEAPTRLVLGERLAEFGLTDAAAQLARGLDGDAARRLRARVLLMTGDPAGALVELTGLDDDAARELRAQAERQTGAAVTPPAAPEAAVAGPEPLAATMDTGADVGLMQRGAALLSESAQLREALDAILDPDR